MASGRAFWAVALTSDPVRKMAVSTAFLGNDTVMLRRWFSINHCQQTGRTNARPMTGSEQSMVPQAETWIVHCSAPCANASRLSQAMMWRALGRAAYAGVIALVRFFATLSRKPVVESQR